MKTYTGGCHCQKVRYEITIEELTDVISCNCSICAKRGWLLTFIPTASFNLLKGEDEVTVYHFNKNQIDHTFCKTCGTASYGIGKDGEGNEMVAINVRCLDDVDIDTLTVVPYNGKEM